MSADSASGKVLKLVGEPSWWQRPPALRLGLAGALAVLGTVVLSVDFFGLGTAGVMVGRPSPISVKADRSISFVDVHTTAARRQAASRRVERAYRNDPAARTRAENDLRSFFATVRSVGRTRGLTLRQRAGVVRERTGLTLETTAVRYVLGLKAAKLARLEARAVDVLDNVMGSAVKETALGAKRAEVASVAEQLPLSLGDRQALSEIVGSYLEPNLIFDPAHTDALRQAAAARVVPEVARWQKGQTIVSEGDIVTPAQKEALRRLDVQGVPPAARAAGMFLVVIAALLATGRYLAALHPRIYGDMSRLTLLSVLVLGFLVAAKLLVPFYPPYVVPFAAVAMLSTILLNTQVGVYVAFLVGLLAGGLVAGSVPAAMVAVFSGLAGVSAVARLQSRSELMGKGLAVCAATGYLSLAVSFALTGDVTKALVAGAWGVGGGVLAAIATAGFLPFLESGFGVTTNLRLADLANPTQPLLHRLMLEAPGTYSHSVVTGNLAEAAAHEIGANALLARVGAYYHDIGKIRRPLFFVENQIGGESPHDGTSPSLSCLAITAHVREGVELARQAHLPQEIIDIIGQHHGTSVMTYFYHQAKLRQDDMNDVVREIDYRYSEERPKSREAALVMLADSVEAAARATPKPTPARLEQVGRRIVAERLADKQLEKSDLSLADLEKVTAAFARVLAGLHHPRVEYPDVDELSKARRLRGGGDTDS